MPTDFEDLRGFGDELEGDLRRSFLRMVAAAEQYEADFAGTADVLSLIRNGNTAALQAYGERLLAQGLIPRSLDFLNVMLLIMLRSGIATTVAGTALDLELSEEIINVVRRFSMNRGNQRITSISNETMLNMKNVMLDALKRGVGAEQLGRELRGSIGLLPSHESALRRYGELLDFKGVPDPQRTTLHNRYRSRLLAWRAEMISRTETMYAVHAGQMASWVARINLGLIQPSTTWIEWVVTDDDRLCDRCAPMDGKQVRFGQRFEFNYAERGYPNGKPAYADSPYDRRMARRGSLKPKIPDKYHGGSGRRETLPKTPKGPAKKNIYVFHPPLHPNCRCTLRLRFET